MPDRVLVLKQTSLPTPDLAHELIITVSNLAQSLEMQIDGLVDVGGSVHTAQRFSQRFFPRLSRRGDPRNFST
jgi:hypothetical protein